MKNVMKAIGVRFAKGAADQNPIPNSVELLDNVPIPEIDQRPGSRQVLVKVWYVGLDATDKEIMEGKYGRPPEGSDYLIIGHEVFGQVVKIGDAVKHVKEGDFVTCTVRRDGTTIYDKIGRNDLTSDTKYYERGIAYLHGFLTEYFLDEAEYVVKMPESIKHLHVLAEPSSVVAKGIKQAYLAQEARLQVWQPRLAFVLGAGQIGLLATLMLKLRGLEVFTLARTSAKKTPLKAKITEALGGHYISTAEESMKDLAIRVGLPDFIFEATGSGEIAFQAMEVLNRNGVLIWSSITGEVDGQIKQAPVPINRINLDWVLGNKMMFGTVNANPEHFRLGIADMLMGNEVFPGVLEQILTHSIDWRDLDPKAIFQLLSGPTPPLKVYVNLNAA